jgi:NAD(P)-dependent dehydrogenase (short-subunit alcohol dehydrogenase family)
MVTNPSHRKVAIVTGGSQGIGAGIVEGYRHDDRAVVAAARTITAIDDPAVQTVARTSRILGPPKESPSPPWRRSVGSTR